MKDTSIRISVVSFLNAKPFLKGLEDAAGRHTFQIQQDIPSVCAARLMRDEADIGLIPVAMIPQLPEAHIISDYCIAADGDVDSVLLVSTVPLPEIRTILMDKESRTSVQLARILARDYWKIPATFREQAPEQDFSDSATVEAAVLIGDKALEHRGRYPYVYDLAGAWKDHTGLPFVFATWTSNKAIHPDRVAELNEMFRAGIAEIPAISHALAAQYPYADIADYLGKKIVYRLDTAARQGLQLFFEKLGTLEPVGSGTMVTTIDIK